MDDKTVMPGTVTRTRHSHRMFHWEIEQYLQAAVTAGLICGYVPLRLPSGVWRFTIKPSIPGVEHQVLDLLGAEAYCEVLQEYGIKPAGGEQQGRDGASRHDALP